MSSKTKKDSQMSFDQGQERETVDNVIEVKRVSKVFRIYESPMIVWSNLLLIVSVEYLVQRLVYIIKSSAR